MKRKRQKQPAPVPAPQPTQMDQVLGGLQAIADQLTNGGELVAAGIVLAGRQTIRRQLGELAELRAQLAKHTEAPKDE